MDTILIVRNCQNLFSEIPKYLHTRLPNNTINVCIFLFYASPLGPTTNVFLTENYVIEIFRIIELNMLIIYSQAKPII